MIERQIVQLGGGGGGGGGGGQCISLDCNVLACQMRWLKSASKDVTKQEVAMRNNPLQTGLLFECETIQKLVEKQFQAEQPDSCSNRATFVCTGSPIDGAVAFGLLVAV